MSKPTTQDIADALSVSRITVWKALSNRPGVSDSMRAQIHQKATEMGYFHTPSQDSTATISAQLPPHTRTVAVAVCRPESSLFWMQIIHQIAKDLSEHNVNLMYTYLPTNYKAGYVLPEPLTNGTVDGVIVLNTYSAPLLRLLSSLPIPKVFLDTVPSVPYNQLHGDLLIIEGRDLIRQITNSLLLHGCRKPHPLQQIVRLFSRFRDAAHNPAAASISTPVRMLAQTTSAGRRHQPSARTSPA